MYIIINDGGLTGYSIVEQLLVQHKKLILIDRNSKENIKLSHPNLHVFCFDFYKTETISEEIHLILNEREKLDGFVYAAGIGGARPLGLTNTPFVHEMMNANLYAFIEFARILTKKKYMKDGGSVVAISSVSSIKGLKSKIAYAASKAALDAAVRGMAVELSDRKIRVNSIRKGWVEADMGHGFIQDNIALSGQDDLSKQLLGLIDTADLAKMVCFLLSEDARFITGINQVFDGGYTLS